jgi:hypothetical protein
MPAVWASALSVLGGFGGVGLFLRLFGFVKRGLRKGDVLPDKFQLCVLRPRGRVLTIGFLPDFKQNLAFLLFKVAQFGLRRKQFALRRVLRHDVLRDAAKQASKSAESAKQIVRHFPHLILSPGNPGNSDVQKINAAPAQQRSLYFLCTGCEYAPFPYGFTFHYQVAGLSNTIPI